MNGQDKWITWLLLGAIVWELSQLKAATPGAVALGQSDDGSCCGACQSGTRTTQFSMQSPAFVKRLRNANAVPFTFEGVM